MLQERRLILFLVLSRSCLSTDGFKWSLFQQSSHVTSIPLGSNVTLPCKYVLTSQEQKSMNQFHIVTWSKEVPAGSAKWMGLALRSSLVHHQSQVIHGDKGRIRMDNDTLLISNVGLDDHTQYQCEVRSSFYTTPSILKLNVLYRPIATKIVIKTVEISSGDQIQMNCTSDANPSAKYNFFVNRKLMKNSSSNQFIVDKASKEHEGEYSCVPWNNIGEGPVATVDITILDTSPTDRATLFTTEVIAGIVGCGGLLLIIVVVLIVIICHRRKPKEEDSGASHLGSRTNKALSRSVDASQAYIGPGIYGSQSLEQVTSDEFQRARDQSYSLNLQNSDCMTPGDSKL